MLKQSFSQLPRNKRIVALAVLLCVIVAIAVAAVILLRKPSATVVSPVVTVAPARIDDVEIYGEYVGRVRASQFVEVRARRGISGEDAL